VTTKRYRTILADPPWEHQQRGGRGAIQHYPLLALERIAALRVAEIASDDAHLWLWVTNASLHAGRTVMDAWGFSLDAWIGSVCEGRHGRVNVGRVPSGLG
jgi:N6-adenosine-specific RNA methylase IME4